MASITSLTSEFADGTYTFALPIAQIHELEQKCGVGIGRIFGRILTGRMHVGGDFIAHPAQAQYSADDLVETIRLALIGGGKGEIAGEEVKVTPVIARRLVDNYVIGQPMTEAWTLAAAILTTLMFGNEPEKFPVASEADGG